MQFIHCHKDAMLALWALFNFELGSGLVEGLGAGWQGFGAGSEGVVPSTDGLRASWNGLRAS